MLTYHPHYNPGIAHNPALTAPIESAFMARMDDWCGRLLLPLAGESGEWMLTVDQGLAVPKFQWLFTTSREMHPLKFLLRCEEDVARPQTGVWLYWRCVRGAG